MKCGKVNMTNLLKKIRKSKIKHHAKARCFYYALKEVINGVITVKKGRRQITVSGHAGYAEKGHDIVCAAVSILIYNLQNSIERLTDDS